MKLDFQECVKKIYNKDVDSLFWFQHMDVLELGGELEVSDHGWTDSIKMFRAGNRGEKSAGQGLTSIPRRAQVQDALTFSSSPTFFFQSAIEKKIVRPSLP